MPIEVLGGVANKKMLYLRFVNIVACIPKFSLAFGVHIIVFQLMCVQGMNQPVALNDACTARVRMLGSDVPGAKGRHTSPKLRWELGWGKLKDGEDTGKEVKTWKAQSVCRPLK